VPMILHGDEMGRTQNGNNNTYAQDSEIAWMHWDQADRPLIEFTAAVSRLRAAHPTFQRRRFFSGSTYRDDDGGRLNDIVWLGPKGKPMEEADWGTAGLKVIGMYLNGSGIPGLDATGNRITDDDFLLYFNAGDEPVKIKLPPKDYSPSWKVLIDTAAAEISGDPHKSSSMLVLEGPSVIVLQQYAEPESEPDLSVAASLVAYADPPAATTRRGR
jgi:isoamylase